MAEGAGWAPGSPWASRRAVRPQTLARPITCDSCGRGRSVARRAMNSPFRFAAPITARGSATGYGADIMRRPGKPRAQPLFPQPSISERGHNQTISRAPTRRSHLRRRARAGIYLDLADEHWRAVSAKLPLQPLCCARGAEKRLDDPSVLPGSQSRSIQHGKAHFCDAHHIFQVTVPLALLALD